MEGNLKNASSVSQPWQNTNNLPYFSFAINNLQIWEEPTFPYYFTFTVLGLLGNTLALLIMIKQRLIKDGVWTYLACLSVADNLVLISSFIWEFSLQKPYLGIEFNNNEVLCKFFPHYTVLRRISHYILAVMTFQRFILLYQPYRKPPGPNRLSCIVSIPVLSYQQKIDLG